MNTNKHALSFGLITSFLTGLGFTIISPVVPFMVQPFTNSQQQALIVTSLTAVYALCTFLAAPAIGSLSDRFGRRPILIFSLLGSAIGYLIFGWAGSLWMLFAGRIIDGLTGGNIVALFAYLSDISEPKDRTKIFGWAAAAVGVGTITGPVIGGLLAQFGNSVPFIFGALISLINMAYGLIAMPESLTADKRLSSLPARRLNPFTSLFDLFSLPQLSRLFMVGLLVWLPSGSLQAIVSQFALDSFAWQAVIIGLIFAIMGLMDILTQTLGMKFLLKHFSDQDLMRLALTSELIGYLLISLSALLSLWPLFILAMFIYAFGDSVFGTAYNGQVSKTADENDQGKVQGGSQALQSLARVAGPLLGGGLYSSLGHASPAFLGVLFLGLALITVALNRSSI
ncbi:MFS transporter [Lactococcus termiticola]|uniref:Tetracycline resistance MFS efflux pump n=1 Tax=Lactococcus termiticola TaxID=2169526 RepID=A0A2R5HIE9_9LACT|nr:MFS transporter [Lactococcus termiticola]GBG96088.1 tetracycline resistance MFS efflux pump [Lactococcus termiticola]